MAIPSNVIVYCDANFLVAYGAKQTKQPAIQKRAQILFAELLANNCEISASSLSFDEAWNGVRKEVGPKRISNKIYFFLNKALNKFGLYYKNSGVIEFSFGDVFNDIKNFTEKLMASSKFVVIQFPASKEKDGIGQALSNVKNFKLRPRDSFHLSVMQLNNIKHVITIDKDFEKSGISVLTF